MHGCLVVVTFWSFTYSTAGWYMLPVNPSRLQGSATSQEYQKVIYCYNYIILYSVKCFFVKGTQSLRSQRKPKALEWGRGGGGGGGFPYERGGDAHWKNFN